VDKSLYRFLKWTAILLTVAWIGWSFYDSMIAPRNPGDLAYLEGNNLFEDGEYPRALAKFDQALSEDPNHLHAMRGRALSLMQLGQSTQALAAFGIAISLDPEFGATYANRGVLHDRMGRYKKAIADYERGLALDPELVEGPHWLTRFLRNQPQKPPGIADRAAYLRQELAKPESERLLRVPELDAEQRTYKQ
jgi:tetratricopeptide (TPR) repeat protein